MSTITLDLVEEWLNRNGFFTIRGIRIGDDDLDILAVKFHKSGLLEYRHLEIDTPPQKIEVNAPTPLFPAKKVKTNPTNYDLELLLGVKNWVKKKFHSDKKRKIAQSLAPGSLTSELVVNHNKSERELRLISRQGIKIHMLDTIVSELRDLRFRAQSDSSGEVFDLSTAKHALL